MNTLLLEQFTSEILQGANSLGLKLDGQLGILKPDQAHTLEQSTGRTISELALLGIASSASAAKRKQQKQLLHETLELMKIFDSHPSSEPTDSLRPALRR